MVETLFIFHLSARPPSSFYTPHLPSVVLCPTIVMTMTRCQGAAVGATTLRVCAGEAGSWFRATAGAKGEFKQSNQGAVYLGCSVVPLETCASCDPPHLNDFQLVVAQIATME